MLKIKSILVSLLALGAMASCSTNELEGEDTRTGADLDVAYMSLRITLPTQKASTRAAGTSTEKNPTGREGDVNSLYVITFDKDQKLVHHSRKNPVIVLGSGDLALQASGNQGTTEAILVSASTKYLLVVVNPGTLLETRLKALTAGALYNDINMAIVNSLASNSKPETLVGEIADPADSGKGFTMINAGSYDVSGDKWNQGCLLDVEANVISVDGTTIKDEAAAKEEAEKVGKRATLKIERLAAKVEVAVKSSVRTYCLKEQHSNSVVGHSIITIALSIHLQRNLQPKRPILQLSMRIVSILRIRTLRLQVTQPGLF